MKGARGSRVLRKVRAEEEAQVRVDGRLQERGQQMVAEEQCVARTRGSMEGKLDLKVA